jgi:uncharacterized glyoxalase superfamily protein PhnB
MTVFSNLSEPLAGNIIAMKITPVLFVDAIEPSLPFWVNTLGFELMAEVPEAGRLGFVILKKGDAELMLQTRQSVGKDLGQAADRVLTQSASVYVEVDSFAEIVKRVKGTEVLVPQRDTAYGMREIFVREPQGHVVGFAARLDASDAGAV